MYDDEEDDDYSYYVSQPAYMQDMDHVVAGLSVDDIIDMWNYDD